MREIGEPRQMREWSRAARAAGRRVGLVPTMGYLHEGHLRLIDAAVERADRVAVSIFVNPLQFGAGEDLARYPRDLERDRRLVAARGVHCLFAPDESTFYPEVPIVRVAPGRLGNVQEGASRPGHFEGVLTVVAKLFHVVEPDVAIFGRKDYQQAVLVERMVRDLDFPVEIVVVPTVRELDGLAMSSRNAYLNSDERRSALALSRALRAIERAWRNGETDGARLEDVGRQVLEETPAVTADYVAVVEPHTLQPAARVTARTVAAVAAWVGNARLIDNIILGEGFHADATAAV